MRNWDKETLKKYGWLLLVIPIAGVFTYSFFKERKAIKAQMKKVRSAKADIAILKSTQEHGEIETKNNGDS